MGKFNMEQNNKGMEITMEKQHYDINKLTAQITNDFFLDTIDVICGADPSGIDKTEDYKVKNLESSVDYSTYIDNLTAIRKKPKDLKILGKLMDLRQSDGTITILNTTQLAEGMDIGVTRPMVNAVLASSVECELMRELDLGIYMVNPNVILPPYIEPEEEQAQLLWEKWEGLTWSKSEEIWIED